MRVIEPLKLYNAGLYTSNFHLAGTVASRLDERELQLRKENKWYLESYHYVHRETAVDKMRAEQASVFLDSGAFSALSQGVTIDIGGYCEYIQVNTDIIEKVGHIAIASVLDEIGDAEGTWKNQHEMERRGVRPLPCFHAGEPMEYLDHYAKNYDYITLGGLVGGSTKVLMEWLDVVWERLVDSDGYPITKVHGFGITSLPLMLRYPWFSVDSSTWVQWSANGMLLMPFSGRQVNISNKSSARKVKGQHIDNIAPIERDVVEAEIRSVGIDPDRLRENYFSRWAWNCWAFPKYAELNCAPKPFVRERPGLLW